MRSAIATMIWCDSPEDASNFPQSPHKNSASKSHQLMYWRCAVVMFATARRNNSDVRLLCFTNVVNDVPSAIAKQFAQLNVELLPLNGQYMPSKENHTDFRNNFNKLEIVNWIAATGVTTLFVDADCVVLRALDSAFANIDKFGAMYYDYLPWDEQTNAGLTVEDIDSMLQKLGRDTRTQFFTGGEFWGMNAAYAKSVEDSVTALTHLNKAELSASDKRFYTEEHILTALNALFPGVSAGRRYVRRIWHFHRKPILAPSSSDLGLCVWHVPGQKDLGIDVLYALHSRGFQLTPKLLAVCLGIPRYPLLIQQFLFGWRRLRRLMLRRA